MRSRILLATAAFVVLGCAYTWPLVLHPRSTVAHDRGDPLLVTWILWWSTHTVPLTEGTRRQAIVQRLWEVRRLGRPLFHVNGSPLGALRSEWRRACEKAGVPCGR